MRAQRSSAIKSLDNPLAPNIMSGLGKITLFEMIFIGLVIEGFFYGTIFVSLL